ncbi:hypothetical protein AWB91_17020 [Mycobacterium paraense]|uniref:DUF3027 domain-containing protein n=1 Tax=Mycobacterium paraense TaxID=767916 RepID=A0ABX3VPE8_9MYCO|nr:DUF3027 domain-containing protein [Mycobacterium paraense]ORW31051.1 hypothetical protein AWB91_17020 [Mycobacterium paraense]ORW45348.1 hypothetical protein AWB88_04295 [Mycobacterium paraense]
MTGPGEGPVEPAATTVAEWPDELAAVLTAAADGARAAVEEFAGPEAVGDYLGVGYEDPNAATHRFLAHLPGYQGWQWAAVVAAYPGCDHATISEVVLIPGPTALLAPEWVPWDQRVRPGDLSPGDLLAPAADDPRLVPGYTASGDPEVDETAAEIGLGRRWVMSALGRAEAAERWHTGDHGPDSAMARSTKRMCRDCGFFLPLAGSLGAMFGVCGNELSADGQVVDKQYGCGAHSDTPAPAGTGSPAYEPYDDGVLDVADNPPPPEPAEPESPPEPAEPESESPPEPAEPESAEAESPEPGD